MGPALSDLNHFCIQHKTIESVLERGEKLDNLVERSTALSAQSKMFYKTAKKVRRLLQYLAFFLKINTIISKTVAVPLCETYYSILPLCFVFRIHTLSVIPVYTNLHTHGLLFLLLCRHWYAPRGAQAWSQHSFIESESTFLSNTWSQQLLRTTASKFFTVLTMTMRISRPSPRFVGRGVTEL